MIRQCAVMLFSLFSGRPDSQGSILNETENNMELHEADHDVFPNPFIDEINLKLNTCYDFKLIHSSGELIQEGNSSQESMIIGQFLKGIYLLKIRQGETSKIFKLLKV